VPLAASRIVAWVFRRYSTRFAISIVRRCKSVRILTRHERSHESFEGTNVAKPLTHEEAPGTWLIMTTDRTTTSMI
jgi:hypothetical protein